MKKTCIYVLLFSLLLGNLLPVYKSAFWSAFYRLKYITLAYPPQASLLTARRVVECNPFYNQHHAVLINMALKSSSPRLQVINLRRKQVVFKTRVMHGVRSGAAFANEFSNELGSNKTALGRYVIVGQYQGKYGKAYRLAGLDATNSNALSRSIVLHQSQYVSSNRIGRSEGCPAVSSKAILAMKPYLHVGTLVWMYN